MSSISCTNLMNDASYEQSRYSYMQFDALAVVNGLRQGLRDRIRPPLKQLSSIMSASLICPPYASFFGFAGVASAVSAQQKAVING